MTFPFPKLTRDIDADKAAGTESHILESNDVQTAVNRLADYLNEYVIFASAYGWDPAAPAATNDAAIAAAIDDARDTDLPIFIGLGTYHTTTTVDMGEVTTTNTAVSMFGVTPRASVIVCDDNAADLMYHSGFRGYLHNFKVEHVGTDPDATYGDGLVFRKAAYCRYSLLSFDNCRRNISVAQEDVNDPGTSSGGGNWVFSCTFDNINTNRCSESGLFLRSWSGRSTGNVWTNIYVQNKAVDGTPRTSTGPPVDLFLLEDGVFNQLNIEDFASVSIALLANSGGAITFNSLHFERVTLDGFNSQYVRAFGDCNVIINGLNVAFCDVAGPNATGHSRLVSASTGGRVVVNGASVNNLTRTKTSVQVPLYRVAAGNGDGSSAEYGYEVELLHATTPTTFDGDSDNLTDDGLKRVGDTLYGITGGGGGGAATDHSAARIHSTGDQAIAAFTQTTAVLGSTDYNVGLDVATNANAVTIPAGKGGLYQVSIASWFTGGSSGERNVAVYKNGAAVLQGGIVGTQGRPALSGTLSLAAGDVVTMSVFASAACTLHSFGAMDVSMSVARLGASS